MKRIFPLLALALCLAASAQNANYEQAARFSTKHLQNLVYSTRIRPGTAGRRPKAPSIT